MIANTVGPTRDLPNSNVEGIVAFSSPVSNWIIENNIIQTGHHHGISAIFGQGEVGDGIAFTAAKAHVAQGVPVAFLAAPNRVTDDRMRDFVF